MQIVDYQCARLASHGKIQLTREGTEAFARLTREHLNQRLAISLNGRLYSAPVIRSEITTGKAQITGSFTCAEASDLVAAINEALQAAE